MVFYWLTKMFFFNLSRFDCIFCQLITSPKTLLWMKCTVYKNIYWLTTRKAFWSTQQTDILYIDVTLKKQMNILLNRSIDIFKQKWYFIELPIVLISLKDLRLENIRKIFSKYILQNLCSLVRSRNFLFEKLILTIRKSNKSFVWSAAKEYWRKL